jgi:hypothetical protein
MGIPYSREINAAFEQVTPLVASGYQVLETTKNIAVALFVIQIITVFLLTFILLSLIGLIISTNPDLDYERKQIVTPAVKWITSWYTAKYNAPVFVAGILVAMFAIAGFGFLFWVYYKRSVEDAAVDGPEDKPESELGKKGKDVENVKKGDTSQ